MTIPADSMDIIAWNPVTFTYTTLSTAIATGNKWGDGVLTPNGKIYGIPHTNDLILSINPGSKGRICKNLLLSSYWNVY
ncbi:hypothetical protein [Leptospira biflexa]|uniref:Uncharacterized protein n=1 Tax=Leptospira biflexa serovar Patoc (strain Patoc 1 / ATCC 23582 / Paris) TaxID=456481 RepID=B0SNT1_LEPBP|nr:hypothetical protein [Leptospira biflexa]ABZ97362.1 Hypothetical protein LEPBI_I1250 [Leptospira biflexa serovar Patoc strain 'Patoc 1 (Paris)']